MTAAAPARWITTVTDALGFVVVIWSIPFAIILAGLPIVLLVVGARMIANWIW